MNTVWNACLVSKIITILSTSEAMKKYTKFLWTCNYAIIYDIKN